jgi:hypothetical protein
MFDQWKRHTAVVAYYGHPVSFDLEQKLNQIFLLEQFGSVPNDYPPTIGWNEHQMHCPEFIGDIGITSRTGYRFRDALNLR